VVIRGFGAARVVWFVSRSRSISLTGSVASTSARATGRCSHHSGQRVDNRGRSRDRGPRAGDAWRSLYSADEIFPTGAASEAPLVRSLDRIRIGNGRRGPMAEALQRRFFDVVCGAAPDTHGWLTYVRGERSEQWSNSTSSASRTRPSGTRSAVAFRSRSV